ncbi:hypothetical protein AABB24_022636 [Solanum stoloniferum]|uniref:Uncharacterized protein n=1 Tax=Solanum stoloniferum TaxID=62892 RepID=A0ABD2T0T0_9SOLN
MGRVTCFTSSFLLYLPILRRRQKMQIATEKLRIITEASEQAEDSLHVKKDTTIAKIRVHLRQVHKEFHESTLQIWNEHFLLQSQDTCGVLWRSLPFGEISRVCQDTLAIVLSLLFLTSCFMSRKCACAFLLIFFHFPFRGGCGGKECPQHCKCCF